MIGWLGSRVWSCGQTALESGSPILTAGRGGGVGRVHAERRELNVFRLFYRRVDGRKTFG